MERLLLFVGKRSFEGTRADLQPGMEYLLIGDDGPYLDPYAKALNTPTEWMAPRDELRGIHIADTSFDWEGIKSPGHKWNELVIYEMHVRAFTQHPSSQVQYPGTYLGMIEKIPHLLDLGINCVELMPMFEFDERAGPNFWGYDTVNFFCPMKRYAVDDPIVEFKELIKALHRAGIEVILDVVYNHSSSFEFDLPGYYLLEDSTHTNYSGCGNTLGANLPKMQKLMLDSLRYWTQEFHIDGFRFDLAAAMARGGTETLDLITREFHDKKLIAEPWDPGGMYLLGQFPNSWAEWSDIFRDGVRQHVNFNAPMPAEDLSDRPIQYVVSHDGFTLTDLVSYKEKHNAANGEDNRDGSDHNFSDNCGVEGQTQDIDILNERKRRMCKMLELMFAGDGIPMLLMGTEYGHTRNGNNNAWCQDNELNWFLWDELEKNRDWFDIVQTIIVDRKRSH